MSAPAPRLNFRQTIETMTLTFNPAVAGDLAAVIEFDAGGAEPGVYHLRIGGRECTFHAGPAAPAATLTIATPSELWLKIRRGELDAQEALARGLCTARGDLSLMRRMGELFRPAPGFSVETGDSTPPGPIPLSGMAWLQAAFVPWYVFWLAFGLGAPPLLAVGLPLLLALLVFGYRFTYNQATPFELGGVAFFAAAGLLTVTGDRVFAEAGSLFASLALAALWFGSVLTPMPLCGEYLKWSYIKPMWRTSLFVYPNAVIALVWGEVFWVGALIGIFAAMQPAAGTPLTALRFGLIVPAIAFTRRLGVPDFEPAMLRVRLLAGIGLAATAALFIALCVIVWVVL